MANYRGPLIVAIALSVVLGGAAALLFWRNTPDPITTNGTQGQDDQKIDAEDEIDQNSQDDQKIDALRSTALELQGQRHWCKAWDAWTKVREASKGDAQWASFVAEADGNLRLLEPLCRPTKPLVEELKLPEPKEPPTVISPDDVLDHYPVGRTIRSIGLLHATGQGRNEDWLLRGDVRFAYEYRGEVETVVLKNNGTRIVFEQRFGEVAQLRAVSDEALELALPESPILAVVWAELDRRLMNFPLYVTVRNLAELTGIADPRFRRILTFFHNRIHRDGDPLDEELGIDVAAQLERLSGARFEIEYVSGFGVSNIKALDGGLFTENDLMRIAYNSGVLMDYFVGEAAGSEPGERVTLRLEDVGNLLPIGGNYADGMGTLVLENAGPGEEPGESLFNVVGGEVSLHGKVNGIEHDATLQPAGGQVAFRDGVVRWGRVNWHASDAWVAENHLLFGTTGVKDAQIQTYYEGEPVEDGSRLQPDDAAAEPEAAAGAGEIAE